MKYLLFLILFYPISNLKSQDFLGATKQQIEEFIYTPEYKNIKYEQAKDSSFYYSAENADGTIVKTYYFLDNICTSCRLFVYDYKELNTYVSYFNKNCIKVSTYEWKNHTKNYVAEWTITKYDNFFMIHGVLTDE